MNEQAKDFIKEMIEDGSASMQMEKTPKLDAHGKVYAEDIGIYIRVIKPIAPVWHHSSTDLYTKCGANGSMTSIMENVTCKDCLATMERLDRVADDALINLREDLKLFKLSLWRDINEATKSPMPQWLDQNAFPPWTGELPASWTAKPECTCKSLLNGHGNECPLAGK